MSDAFNTALHQVKRMSRSEPPKVSVEIQLGMAGGGGLSSVQRRMNIGGQPHRLAYITTKEEDLLKQLGGLGEPVEGTRGVPAYIGVTDDTGDAGESYDADVGGWSEGVGDFDWVGDPADPGEEGKYEAAAGLNWGLHGGIDYAKGGLHEGALSNIEIDDPFDQYAGDPAALTGAKILATAGNPLGLLGVFYNLFQKHHPEFEAKRTTLDAVIESEFSTRAEKEAAAKAKDAIEQDWFGVYGREGRAEYERMAQMETNPEVERAKRQKEKQEDKKEEEKKGLMAQLLSMMKDEKEEDEETRYDPWKLQLGQAYGPNWRELIEGSTNV